MYTKGGYLEMMKWRVYYGDGSTFSNEDGDPSEAPALNVQIIIVRDDDPHSQLGRYAVHKFDFYWWDDPDWFGGELFGLFDYLSRPGHKRVLFGRTVGNADFQAIVDRALADPDFIRKSKN
jgi:hypothetical protein